MVRGWIQGQEEYSVSMREIEHYDCLAASPFLSRCPVFVLSGSDGLGKDVVVNAIKSAGS